MSINDRRLGFLFRIAGASLPLAVGPSPATASDAEEITVAAVGDIMPGSTWPRERLPPHDGARLFDEVKPFLAPADIAFGNLEGPLIDGGSPAACRPEEVDCHRFRVPTRYGRLLKDAGFDVLSLANNHALDFGPEGRESTERALEALGIAYSGRPGSVARLDVKGRRVAMVAFAAYDGSRDVRDLAEAARAVSELAAENDIVIVSFHGGAEGRRRERVPRGAERSAEGNHGDVRAFARAVVDAGADLVLGHGPHVARGMEVYRGRLVAYSLGNFATYGGFGLRGPLGLAVILQARLGPDGTFRGGKLIAARQKKPGGPRLDRRGTVIRRVWLLSREDFGFSAVKVSPDGTLAPR